MVENEKQRFVVIDKGNNDSYSAVKANAPIFVWIYLFLFVFLLKMNSLISKRKSTERFVIDPIFAMLNLSILGFCINLVVCPAEYYKLTIQFSAGLFIGIILFLGLQFETRNHSYEAHRS